MYMYISRFCTLVRRQRGRWGAEMCWEAGDNIVDIRTASRQNPGVKGGSLSLSMSYGVQVSNPFPITSQQGRFTKLSDAQKKSAT